MSNCKNNVFAHGKSFMLDQMFWANANTVEPGLERKFEGLVIFFFIAGSLLTIYTTKNE